MERDLSFSNALGLPEELVPLLVDARARDIKQYPEYIRETLIREYSIETQAKNIESELNGKI
jgi:hypothetical protein